jgi:cytochrome c oxidase cbb3-type subunit 3
MSVLRIGAMVAAGLTLLAASTLQAQSDVEPERVAPAVSEYVRNSALTPGGSGPVGVDRVNPFTGDSVHIANGARWYDWYNCSGCHAGGGGGMGPPLMDEQWIYGGRPSNLYDSIVSGRPAGMPAFGALIPPQQIWEIIAFIESMGGMPAHEPPRDAERPKTSTVPAGTDD